MASKKYLLLNLPNPLNTNVNRGFSGGFGTIGSLSGETLIPIYLLYGASALNEQNVEFEVIEAQGLNYRSEDVLDALDKFQPEVIITWISLPSLYEDLAIIEKIHKKIKMVVALGAVCNVMPDEVLKTAKLAVKAGYPHYNSVKNIVKGIEANDFTLIEGASYYENNKLIENPTKYEETVDNLWFDVYKKLPINSYIGDFEGLYSKFKCIPILTSVGCPFSCMYCPYPIGYGKKTVCKSVKRTIQEIIYLKESFGINGFVFRAQNFTYNNEWVNELCDAIIQENLEIHWLAETRADLVSENTLEKMKRAGCFRIHYGVETGAPELEKMGKPGLDIKRIKETFKITKELEIFTMAHIIIGLPGEDKNTLDKTIQTLIELDPDAISINLATPYPGTKLFEYGKNMGFIETFDYSRYSSFEPIMRTENFRLEDLISAQKEMKYKFLKYKLIRDGSFRKRYIKSIPRKIKSRMKHFLG